MTGQGITLDPQELAERLRATSEQHRDLDIAITALAVETGHDQVQLARLKKTKLRLRDEIALLRDALRPDIIA